MQTANPERGENLPPRTLEFRQAMRDFQTMFPTIEEDLIECVLRSNSGHVDSTIDQLLQLSKDGRNTRNPNLSRRRNFNPYDDSTDSEDSIPSELLDPPSSSDDDVPVREPPPMYTPWAGDPPPNFFGSNNPVEVPISDKKGRKEKQGSVSHNGKKKKSFRDWNPMLGALPEDFLRILPQQFIDLSTTKEKSVKHPLPAKRQHSHNNVTEFANGAPHFHPPNLGRKSLSKPEFGVTNQPTPPPRDIDCNPGPLPPPRPSKTMDSHRSRRVNGSSIITANGNIEPGNLFIQPAAFPLDNAQFQPKESRHSSSNSGRRRHHHRSSRSNTERFNAQIMTSPPQGALPISSHNLTRRHSDFNSHRMVMVSGRQPDPLMPISHHDMNGSSPLPGERPPQVHRHRSSRSTHHQHRSSSNNNTPPSSRERNGLGLNSHSSSSGRTRQRTRYEEEQYVEDCRLAILLQNEEFIHELKRNEEFLKALEKDRKKENDTGDLSEISPNLRFPKEGEVVPFPDPDMKYPHGSRNACSIKRPGLEDPEKEEERAFKENLKHMGKSARKKFNEIAGKFSVKKKSSSKSLRNVDPVFANCEDDFEEMRGPQSPVFDLY